MDKLKKTSCLEIPFTDAVVQLVEKNGNAFTIIGVVRRAIRKSNHPELEQEFMREVKQDDHDHLLQVCMRYVSVE